MRRALVLGAAALLASCDLFGSGDARREALEEARRRWDRSAPAEYTITLDRTCFCGVEGPAHVRVVDREVVARTYVETGQPVPEFWAQFFPDVEGIFDVIEDAIERDADQLDVTYDSAWGYPSRLFIDYQFRAADEELGLEVLGFTPGP